MYVRTSNLRPTLVRDEHCITKVGVYLAFFQNQDWKIFHIHPEFVPKSMNTATSYNAYINKQWSKGTGHAILLARHGIPPYI